MDPIGSCHNLVDFNDMLTSATIVNSDAHQIVVSDHPYSTEEITSKLIGSST